LNVLVFGHREVLWCLTAKGLMRPVVVVVDQVLEVFIGEVIKIVKSCAVDDVVVQGTPKSFDLAVGLRPIWPCVAMLDAEFEGHGFEGMLFAVVAGCELGAGSTLGAGTLIAFATAPGQVALDGEGANSPFSSALARHIGTPGLEVQQMLTKVPAEVVAATKSKQVPWSNSSLLGEVYLAEK
jgi:hypothetical protein